MSDPEAIPEKRDVLWCESSDRSSAIIFAVEGGGIGIDVGGNAIVMPVREWHALAVKKLEGRR